MRFAELLELGPTKKLVSINDSEYETRVDHWTKTMGARNLFGYRKETRVEHFQEAVDTVYTALEGELQTADPKKIMAHPKWKILITCAARNFPDHISVYQPSPLEQTRIKRMIRNTLTTRVIANKIDLLDILKKDKDYSVATIGDLAVSRLRYELLAASAERVHDQYMKELDSDWVTWYQWQQKKAGWYQGAAEFERNAERATTGFSKGITKAKAEASASFSGSASGGLSLDKEWKKGGLKQTLKGDLQAKAGGSGEVNAEARMADLMASAELGLEAEAGLRADIDYELTYSCKVKGENLRRLLGPEAEAIKVKAGGFVEVEGKASGSGSASASLFKLQNSAETTKDLTGKKETETEPDHAGVRGFKGSLEGEVSLAVVMKGNASVTVGQAAEIELTGDLFAGAKASGELECFINGQGVGLDLGGKLFAGFELGTEQKINLRHPRRGVNIFTLKARESLTFGVGLAGKLSAKATIDEVAFDTEGGATLGLGSSLKASGLISPRGILLVGYDAIAMPAIQQLARSMQNHYPGSVHTSRLVAFSQYLTGKASKAELAQVYLDCRGRMISLVGNLDREADSVQKRAARISGFNGYGKVMGIDEINAVDGFVGNSQSKYFAYATEEITKNDGTVLQSVTSKGGRKGSVVDQDKQALFQAAKDYAGKKKIMRTGECIAFNIIKDDIKSGVVAV